ncbi:hypothetical protein E9993_12770 [Labilibacter sediminis]|nr:hypothetical protein E9993_12770 [Labilibacter sediminis]
MKVLLRIVAIVIFSALPLLSINAQELTSKQKQNVEKYLNRMKDVMDLTDDQIQELTKYRNVVIVKKTECAEKYEKGSNEYNMVLKDIVKSWNVMLRKCTTSEQLEKWKNRENK